MTFVPVIPAGGLLGLRFLDRTMERQRLAHDSQAVVRREEAYFRERIGRIRTAEALVSDRRLLSIALTAFGLEGDLENRFFIRRILEGGTLDPRSLANRLVDKRYLRFAKTFGFGDGLPQTERPGFADRIIDAWKTRSFEAAVGKQDETMRLALFARRELADLASRPMSEDARWFSIMGNLPLRKVVETAFRLPAGFGALDIDRQLSELKARSRSVLGSESVSVLADRSKMELLLRRFLVAAEPTGMPAQSGPNAAALALLQAVPAQV